MREVVGFIQLACALTLGMAGGWAVRQMGLVMGWSLRGLAAIASVRVSRGGCSCQLGRASAPMIPHHVHTMRGPNVRIDLAEIGPLIALRDARGEMRFVSETMGPEIRL